ncbi:hypothetical protein [Actinoplanes sp. NPDC051851]|uniref:hypothetical protein n=1 Tax=Actinoplanes sp. NPDC051851 TaxID=3154753 RepID=UPI003437C499
MGPAHRLRTVLVRYAGGSLRLHAMTGVALAATVTLMLGVIWSGHSRPETATDSDVVRVGVVEGQTVDGYLDAARNELEALTDPSAPAAGATWALVSFREYVPVGGLSTLLAGAGVAQVYARVPLPDTRTQVTLLPVYRMPEDVTAGMLAAALVRDQEQADYLRLARAADGTGKSQKRLREAYGTAAATAAAEAVAYRRGCACLFAAVVRAQPAALVSLALRAGVRSVDPAPEVRSLDHTEFRPPLPEEQGTITDDPSATPVPNGVAGVASGMPSRLPSSIGSPVTSDSLTPYAGESAAAGLPSGTPVAVPSSVDVSPVHDGSDASAEASSSVSGQ